MNDDETKLNELRDPALVDKLKGLLDETLAEVQAMVERDPSPEGRRKARQYAFTEPARKVAALEETN